MFIYEKKLQYPVKIANTNPKLAAVIISQYGGPDGELGASLRYLSQRYSMPYAELKGLLTDIGTDASKRTRVWNPCKYCFFWDGFSAKSVDTEGSKRTHVSETVAITGFPAVFTAFWKYALFSDSKRPQIFRRLPRTKCHFCGSRLRLKSMMADRF